MPIYEYECSKCGHHLEVLQKVSELPLTECPECHGSTLHKNVSSTSFQLKGTGWYATDFKNKGKPQENKSDSGSSDSGSAGKSDTTTTSSKTDNKS